LATAPSETAEKLVGEHQPSWWKLYLLLIMIRLFCVFLFCSTIVDSLLLGPGAILKKREKKEKNQKILKGLKEAKAQPSSSRRDNYIVSCDCRGGRLSLTQYLSTVLRWRAPTNPLFQGVLHPPPGPGHGVRCLSWLKAVIVAALLVMALAGGGLPLMSGLGSLHGPLQVALERDEEDEVRHGWGWRLKRGLASRSCVKARWVAGRRRRWPRAAAGGDGARATRTEEKGGAEVEVVDERQEKEENCEEVRRREEEQEEDGQQEDERKRRGGEERQSSVAAPEMK
jgi:hypothetical protein